MKRTAFQRTAFSGGLGKAVKTFREANEMDQEAFAEKAGWDTRFVQAIEQGEHDLSIGELEHAAEVLKLQASQLMSLGEAFAMQKKERQDPPEHVAGG